MKLFEQDKSVFPFIHINQAGRYGRYGMFLKMVGNIPVPSQDNYYTIARQIVLGLVTGTTYYLDASAENGGNGSIDTPWNTLSAAMSGITNGDCVMVYDGEYGDYSATTTYTAWTVFMSVKGTVPKLSRINIDRETNGNCNLIFFGFEIEPDYVDPSTSGQTGADDPQYAHSVPNTYAKSANPINLVNADNVRIYYCTIYGYNKHLTDRGISILTSDSVRIDHCEVHTVNRGIVWITCTNLTLWYNYVHGTASSFMVDGNVNDSSGILIEGNHCHNMTWLYSEDYCLREPDYYYHGSLLAINSANCTIRKNLLHDGGNSAGVMFYSGATYSNIIFENNVIYDPHNTNAFVMYSPGENIVIRNNTIIGRGVYSAAETNMKYSGALQIYSSSSGFDYSDISFYNNIILGITNFEDGITLLNHSNNIFFAVMDDWAFYDSEDMPNDIVVIQNGSSGDWDYFETNFFNGTLRRDWSYWTIDDAVWMLLTVNPAGHGQILNLTLYSGCDGDNYSDTGNDPDTAIGTLSSSTFLLDNGASRLSSSDAGALN